MNWELYNVVVLFVLLTVSVMICFFLGGVRIPAAKDTRSVRVARWLISLAFFMLAFPILLFGWFKTYGFFVITLSFCLDVLSYFLLMLSVYMLVSGVPFRSVPLRLYVSSAVIALMALMEYLTYAGVLPVVFGIICAVVASPAYLIWIVAFVKVCEKQNTSVFKTFFMEEFFYVTVLSSIYSGFVTTTVSVAFPWSELVLFLFIVSAVGMSVVFMNKVMELREIYRKYTSARTKGSGDNVDEDMARRSEELRANIVRWVEREGFLSQDDGMEGVAADLGTDIHFLRYYFRTQMPSDFRTWRIKLRIDHARKLLEGGSNESMNQLALMSGFANTSNFYKYFKQYTGVTPVEYRDRFGHR